MVIKNVFLFISFAFLFLSYAKADTPPSKEMVDAWWKAKSQEKMDIIGELVEIRLRSKEVAYLVPVGFDRGRNDMFRIAMIRPSLKEVREIDDPVQQGIEANDLDRDGISEVVASSVGSGQGTESGVKAIVQFEGWSPIVLHQTEFDSGCAADLSRCSSKTVSWKFVDLDNDGNSDLIEEITLSEGFANRPVTTSKKVHRFLFKGSQFTMYEVPKNADKK